MSALPAAQKIAAGGTSLTLAKLLTAKEILDSNEVDDDAMQQDLLSRLHDNGAALVRAMQDAGPLLLVLDECHHLLEVWGRLLGEVLDQLPQARVLGLTATPPESLTTDQAALVADLFAAELGVDPDELLALRPSLG